jgi:hypothetical protein
MRHLHPYLKQFPNVVSKGNKKAFVSDIALPDVKEALEAYFDGELHDSVSLIDEDTGRQVLLIKGEKNYILKYGKLRHWKKKLHNTVGIKKTGCYRELTHEFVTLTEINKLTDRAPVCHGFGYTREAGVLQGEEFLLTAFLDDTVMLSDVFRNDAYDESQEVKALKTALLLLHDMIQKGIAHLDPHWNNVLLSQSLDDAWLIDYENGALNIFNKDVALGFVIGRMLVSTLRKCEGLTPRFEEALVDRVVEECLAEFQIDDVALFKRAYAHIKVTTLSRKQRNRIFFVRSEFDDLLERLQASSADAAV